MKYILSAALISFITLSAPVNAQVMLPEEQEERVPSETFDYEDTYHGEEEGEVPREEQQDEGADFQGGAWDTNQDVANPEIYSEDEYLE